MVSINVWKMVLWCSPAFALVVAIIANYQISKLEDKQKARDKEEADRLARVRSENDSITDYRVTEILINTNKLIERSGQQLIIEDALTEVSGEITTEGLLIKYRLKAKLKSLNAIWHFNSFDKSFSVLFGDDITIKGLPTDIGEHSVVVSTKSMTEDQIVPFELRGTEPYVRARHNVLLKVGVKFKIDPKEIISDKAVLVVNP